MAASTSEADVILNRINVSLARSQRLINSWLPPKPETETVEEQENEDDFKSMTEIGGLGSKAAYTNDDSLPDGAFQRKKLSSNDKLLEQLLGKKAANARKKSQEAGKSIASSRHAAPKQLISRPKQSREVDSADEDEGGRAAAFKSKRQTKRSKLRSPSPVDNYDQIEAVADEPPVSPGLDSQGTNAAPIAPETEPKPTKRKATSYLDEVLAQKANKKSRKKKTRITASS